MEQVDSMEMDYSGYYDSNGSFETPCEQKLNQSLGLVLGPYVHSVICVLGLIGNGLMLITLVFSKRPKSISQVLLLHLALADLVIVLVLSGLVVMELWAWPDGGAGCKLLRGGYSLSLYSAALLLAAVSADRYAAVVHARRRLRARSPGLSCLVSPLVWLSAAMLSLPNFIFYEHYVPQHHLPMFFGEQDNYYGLNWSEPGSLNRSVLAPEQNLSQDSEWDLVGLQVPLLNDSAPDPASYVCALRFHDSSTARVMKRMVPTLQFLTGFLVPLLIMCFCYGSVLYTLLRGRGRGTGGRGSGKGGRDFRRERAVHLVLLVTLVFVLCHAPFNIVLLWSTVTQFNQMDCETWDRLASALALSQILALLHCVLNPLLYGFNSAPFRTAFCGVLHKLRPQRRLSSTSQSERSTNYTL